MHTEIVRTPKHSTPAGNIVEHPQPVPLVGAPVRQPRLIIFTLIDGFKEE